MDYVVTMATETVVVRTTDESGINNVLIKITEMINEKEVHANEE